MWSGAAGVTVALTVLGAIRLGRAGSAAGQSPKVVVYKRETCGCCNKWIDYMKAAGFRVSAKNREDLIDIKQRYGITGALASCHTAVVEGYAVEGHVPADVIQRLLRERPEVAGIAVPGMPQGSPGMEGLVREPYSVVAFDGRGGMRLYEAR
jgi:hypothetical protein